MQNLTIAQTLTMSSREIAGLTGKQHKDVLADCRKMFEALNIQSADFSADYRDERGRTYQEFLLDQDLTMTLVMGYSIELRHKVAKRWRELESGTNQLPAMSELEMISRIAGHAAQQEIRITHVEQEVEQIKQGTIPQGYQGYSYLQATYGLSNAKSKQLVMAWGVPNKKVPHVAPGGQVTQMSVANEESFKSALNTMMHEAEQRGTQWYHPKMGRFSISGWEFAA
ncbi:Rha family transcriptional regulator [Serratia ureilytica]|uniref:Rha family transcriptional regulator n=1 Tax=Serratia ureilytica TaxID=300181 RepID=UPI00371280DB